MMTFSICSNASAIVSGGMSKYFVHATYKHNPKATGEYKFTFKYSSEGANEPIKVTLRILFT